MANPTLSNPAFRKTSAATSLGKALFTKNNASKITPAQITNLLRTAGVNIPPSVTVTADVAQIIMAGGMIVSNLDKAVAIRSYAAPTALAIQAAVELLTVCGLADPKSPMIQILKYGAEAAAVVSSAGTNVVADLSFALDSYQQISKNTRGGLIGAFEVSSPIGMVGASIDELLFGGNRLKDLTANLQSSADMVSKQKVYQVYNDMAKKQVTNAGASLLQYQAGKISVFEFMGTIAEKDPLVFYNYFPALKTFLPPSFITVTSSTSIIYQQRGGMFDLATRNYNVSGDYTQNFTTTKGYSKDQIIKAIVDYFLNNGKIFEFLQALSSPAYLNRVSERRISFGDLAALSMMPPYFEKIDASLDIARTLNNLDLTPHDLGYEFVEDMKTNSDIFPELKGAVDQSPAVTFNGIDYLKDNSAAVNKILASKRLLVDQLVAWDMAGDILNLRNNATGKAMLKKWGDTYGLLSEEQASWAKENIAWDASTAAFRAAMAGAYDSAKNIKNYFSVLSVANLFKNDAYAASTAASKKYINDQIESLTGMTQSLDDRLREIQFLSLGRVMNSAALSNIASFFGQSADKIKMGPLESGKLAYVN